MSIYCNKKSESAVLLSWLEYPVDWNRIYILHVGREVLELILYRFYMHTQLKCNTHQTAQAAKGQTSWYSLYKSDGYLYVLFPQTHTKAPRIWACLEPIMTQPQVLCMSHFLACVLYCSFMNIIVACMHWNKITSIFVIFQ